MQRDGRVDAFHDEHAERALHAVDRFHAVVAMYDQLRDQRIVVRRDYTLRRRRRYPRERRCRRADSSPVILPGEGTNVSGFSALMRHSIAWPRIVTGCGRMSGSFAPAAIRICAFTRSTPGDDFRHRMLHLDARVHFDEVQLAGFVHQELDRAGVGVADRAHRFAQRSPRSLCAASALTAGEGDSSMQLLMPPLDGALALAEHLHVSVLIAENLELDVPRALR